MKVVSVLIICLLLIFVVRGEDVTCKAGERVIGGIFTSGSASQCSGLSNVSNVQSIHTVKVILSILSNFHITYPELNCPIKVCDDPTGTIKRHYAVHELLIHQI